jgi:hypothetical protein
MKSPSCLCLYVYLNGAVHKFLKSVMPTLQPLKLLRQTVNIPQTHVPIFMKLGMYVHIMPPDIMSMT